MGSNTEYTVPAQIRFIVEWFSEWSEMQRNDFLPVLAQKFSPKGYVNGLVTGLDNVGFKESRPPSLFQCRIKLFMEWSDTWNESEKEELLAKIKALDSNFASKFDEEVHSSSCNVNSQHQAQPDCESTMQTVEEPSNTEDN